MIVVSIPSRLACERSYGYDLLFRICLGLDVKILESACATCAEILIGDWRLSVHCAEVSRSDLLKTTPDVVCVTVDTLDFRYGELPAVPVIFSGGNLSPASSAALADGGMLQFDIGLAAFYIASGAWEVAFGERDERGRVAGKSSWLALVGMLELPIVEVYARLLKRLLPYEVSARSPCAPLDSKVYVTCDVDRPFDSGLYSPGRIAKRLVRNLFLERRWEAAAGTIRTVSRILSNGWLADPNNTFDYMMSVSERLGLKIAFYFICRRDDGIDAEYDVFSTKMQGLLRSIAERGHSIGIHGSYASQCVPGRLSDEVSVFRRTVESAGCAVSRVEGRQHYLRWDPLLGPGVVESAGVETDLTLGFHDCIGFRRGLCRPFKLFDLASWQVSNVIERPLIAMDSSVVESDYSSVTEMHETYLEAFSSPAKWCREVGGEFVLLWHNSFLKTPGHRRLYEAVLDFAVGN